MFWVLSFPSIKVSELCFEMEPPGVALFCKNIWFVHRIAPLCPPTGRTAIGLYLNKSSIRGAIPQNIPNRTIYLGYNLKVLLHLAKNINSSLCELSN